MILLIDSKLIKIHLQNYVRFDSKMELFLTIFKQCDKTYKDPHCVTDVTAQSEL